MLAPIISKTGSNTYRLTLGLNPAELSSGFDSYDIGLQFDPAKTRLDTTNYNFVGDLKQVNTNGLASGALIASGISATKISANTPLVTLDFTDLSNTFFLVSVNKLNINGVAYVSAQKVQALSTGGTPGSVINGSAGADKINATPGNDTINAGAGFDMVVYANRYAGSSVFSEGGKVVVTNTVSGEVDTITDVERIKFSDHSIAFDIDGAAGKAYRVYKAAFNRDPMSNDLGGLGFWISKIDGGMSMVEVGARFLDSNEFRALYGNTPTNATFLTKVYTNVLGRTPDAEGYGWWLNQLDTNPEKTKAKVLADFAEGFENKANVAELIGNGIHFTE